MSTLSVCTFCSDPITQEFPFKEVVLSALPIADEIVIINGDNILVDDYLMAEELGEDKLYEKSETDKIIIDTFYQYGKGDYYSPDLKIYYNKWESRMRRNMMVLQKSLAISHCTCDYILALDGDEVLHEKDYDKIKQAMELGHDAYTFKVLHFYRDYQHYKVARSGDQWYERRPYLFKNNLGIFDGYRHIKDGICQYTSDLTTWDYKPVMDSAKHTSIEIFHYSFVRSEKSMLEKQNAIEKRHHPDWEDLTEWNWDMSNTKKFEETHPKVMNERIKNDRR